MFGKVTEFMPMKHVERKLGKYGIQLVHFIPGRIRLQSAEWKENDNLVDKITKKLQAQPFVFFIQSTKETGSLVITYDASYITNMKELEAWFGILDEVYVNGFVR
ncbi:HMA2 domain-containing protein [Peribacillus sp. NPDC096540]|uniref:HMA2 domain-containing protein n=1 Tax=Peribacillus sp. NPDC096540 TaxID=3390612 RepID=UPI003D020A99